jgi:hypothetical protein
MRLAQRPRANANARRALPSNGEHMSDGWVDYVRRSALARLSGGLASKLLFERSYRWHE